MHRITTVQDLEAVIGKTQPATNFDARVSPQQAVALLPIIDRNAPEVHGIEVMAENYGDSDDGEWNGLTLDDVDDDGALDPDWGAFEVWLPIGNEKNSVDMADVCELAHTLTLRECSRLKITVDEAQADYDPDFDNCEYTPEAQEVYDYYYKTITETLNV